MGTGRGLEQGFLLYTVAGLAADADRAGKGVSALTNSFSWDVTLDATASDGVTPYPYEFEVIQCIPNASAWGTAVYWKRRWWIRELVPSPVARQLDGN